jgi:hypothetical protein
MEKGGEGMEVGGGNCEATNCHVNSRLTFYENTWKGNCTSNLEGTPEPLSKPISHGFS